MSLDATGIMALEQALGPFAADGEWHQQLPRYVASAVFCEGRRVLDLTCGRGVGCEALRRLGAVRVVGVDARAELVSWAVDHFTSSSVEFRPLPAGGRLPWADGSFDAILALNPNHGLTREHLREVRRLRAPGGLVVLADDEHTEGGIAGLLARSERPAPRSKRTGAFRDAARELLGEPVAIYERPVLAFQYSSTPGGDRPWPHSSTLLLDGADRDRADRLWVFGDPEARLAELVELPHGIVAAQLRRQLAEATRKLEVLELNQTVLEGQMADKEKLVNDLDLEAYSLRQSLAGVSQELEAWRGRGGHPGDGGGRTWQDVEREREREHERQAYVDQLWQSAHAWQGYAESLQAELEQVQSELGMLQSRLEQQVDVERAQREAAEILRQRQAEPSQREIELARELDAAVAQLREIEERYGKTRARLGSLREELGLARTENAEREKLIALLRTELADNRQRLDGFVQEVQAILEERDQLKRDLTAVAAEQERFEERKGKVEANTMSLEDDIRKKAERIQQLERELVGAKVEATAREKDNTRLMQGKAALDRRVEEQDAELARLRTELAEAQRAAEEAQRAAAEAQQALAEASATAPSLVEAQAEADEAAVEPTESSDESAAAPEEPKVDTQEPIGELKTDADISEEVADIGEVVTDISEIAVETAEIGADSSEVAESVFEVVQPEPDAAPTEPEAASSPEMPVDEAAEGATEAVEVPAIAAEIPAAAVPVEAPPSAEAPADEAPARMRRRSKRPHVGELFEAPAEAAPEPPVAKSRRRPRATDPKPAEAAPEPPPADADSPDKPARRRSRTRSGGNDQG